MWHLPIDCGWFHKKYKCTQLYKYVLYKYKRTWLWLTGFDLNTFGSILKFDFLCVSVACVCVSIVHLTYCGHILKKQEPVSRDSTFLPIPHYYLDIFAHYLHRPVMFCLKIWHLSSTFQPSCRLNNTVRSHQCTRAHVYWGSLLGLLNRPTTPSCPRFPGFALALARSTVLVASGSCSWWKRSDGQSMGGPGRALTNT